MKNNSIFNVPNSQLIPKSEATPTINDALVYMRKEDGNGNVEWFGSVIGSLHGQCLPVLVIGFNDHISDMVPMVENGYEMREQIHHWAPWPKVSFMSSMGDSQG